MRAAIYARVSSDKQREKQSLSGTEIKPMNVEKLRALALDFADTYRLDRFQRDKLREMMEMMESLPALAATWSEVDRLASDSPPFTPAALDEFKARGFVRENRNAPVALTEVKDEPSKRTAYLVGFLDTETGAFLGADIFSEATPTVGTKRWPFTILEVNGVDYQAAADSLRTTLERPEWAWAKALVLDRKGPTLDVRMRDSIREQAIEEFAEQLKRVADDTWSANEAAEDIKRHLLGAR